MVSKKNLIQAEIDPHLTPPRQTLDEIPPVGILTGATATGKSKIAFDFALAHGKIELINADSLQVYRGMNIGTAKPSRAELQAIPHHLVDIYNPDETFTAGEFVRAVHLALDAIHARGHRALIVGGTGFYLKALLFGMWDAPASSLEFKQTLEGETHVALFEALHTQDPTTAQRIGPSDRYRLIRALELIHLTGKSPSTLHKEHQPQANPQFRLWVIQRPSEELTIRIQQRTQHMLEQGLIDEFQAIRKKFPNSRSLKSVGYTQVDNYLAHRLQEGRQIQAGLAGLTDEINLATRQLVKKQRTWFRNQLKQLPEQVDGLFELERDRVKLEQALKSLYS